MTIYLGADHRGFALKEKIKQTLASEAYDVVDLGAAEYIKEDDYPDYAKWVAEKVSADSLSARGILVCSSGFGVDITANKFQGVRSALPMSPDHVYQARHDDNANVLALAADFVDEATALKIVSVFLATPFATEERYQRRIEKISGIELGQH
jgi:ribose 5-phosphate isomerase B